MAVLAKFIKGNPDFEDYTPAADMDAGSVVVLGSAGPGTRLGILHSRGVAGVEMGVAVGGGVYLVTLGATLAEFAMVGMDISLGKVLAAANAACDGVLGPILQGFGGADTELARVMHIYRGYDNIGVS